jgi:hypothetical protein
VTKDWDEGRDTWESFGEDGFETASVATFGNATAVVSATDAVWFDLTGLVVDWLGGEVENYGIMLVDPDRAQTQLLSSDIGRIAERPWLHVCYLTGRRS